MSIYRNILIITVCVNISQVIVMNTTNSLQVNTSEVFCGTATSWITSCMCTILGCTVPWPYFDALKTLDAKFK
ncbi:unnamed protein product [Porites lobata]|uniref:Uncharacterized protein n=1 Tax=Porites lobata TaxID=104759 RepID=A0ABN8RYU2_9CNID|nr:unnamed protein product [Porites lobata]